MTSYVTKIETNHEKFSFKPKGKIFSSRHSTPPLSGRQMTVGELEINDLKIQCSFYFINIDTGNSADSKIFGSGGYGNVRKLGGCYVQELVGEINGYHYHATRYSYTNGEWSPLSIILGQGDLPDVFTKISGDFKIENADKYNGLGAHNPAPEPISGTFFNNVLELKTFKGKLYTNSAASATAWHYLDTNTLVQDSVADAAIEAFMEGKNPFSYVPHEQGFILGSSNNSDFRIYDNNLNIVNDLWRQPIGVKAVVEYNGVIFALKDKAITQLNSYNGKEIDLGANNLTNFRFGGYDNIILIGNLLFYHNAHSGSGRDGSLSVLNLDTLEYVVDIDPSLPANTTGRYFLSEDNKSLIWNDGNSILKTVINIETVKSLAANNIGLMASEGDTLRFNDKTINVVDSLGSGRLQVATSLAVGDYGGLITRESREDDYVTSVKVMGRGNFLVVRRQETSIPLTGLDIETHIKYGQRTFVALESSNPSDTKYIGSSGSVVAYPAGSRFVQMLSGSLSSGSLFRASRESTDNGLTWSLLVDASGGSSGSIVAGSPNIVIGENENRQTTIGSLADKVTPTYTWSVKGPDVINGFPGILWDRNETPGSRGLFTIADYEYTEVQNAAGPEPTYIGHPMGVFDARLVKGSKITLAMEDLKPDGLEQHFYLSKGNTVEDLDPSKQQVVVTITKTIDGTLYANSVGSTDTVPLSKQNPLGTFVEGYVDFTLEYATDGIVYIHYLDVRHMLINDVNNSDSSYMIATYTTSKGKPEPSITYANVDLDYSAGMDPAVVPLARSPNPQYALSTEPTYVNRVVSNDSRLVVEEEGKGTLMLSLKDKAVVGLDLIKPNLGLTASGATTEAPDGHLLIDRDISVTDVIPLDTDFYGDFNFEIRVPVNNLYTSCDVDIVMGDYKYSLKYDSVEVVVKTFGLANNKYKAVNWINNINDDYAAIIIGEWLSEEVIAITVVTSDGTSDRTVMVFPKPVEKLSTVTLSIGEMS